MSAASPEPWTTRRLQQWLRDAFMRAGLDSPRLMGEMLLAHVLECDRLRLYTNADRPASAGELDRLRDLVKRALRDEPVQYLVGEAWFYGLRFRCDARALVPRECTGVIVRRVVESWKRRHAEEPVEDSGAGDQDDAQRGPLIADVCTGSGCVAVALAMQLPGARVIATDISPAALTLAAENIDLHAVGDRIELREGDLLEPVARDDRLAGRLDYVVSNPPYIPDDEWADVPTNVRAHEPEIALRGGADGLRFVRPILEQGPGLLAPGGVLLVEVATRRAEAAREILAGVEGIRHAAIHRDQDGLPRVVEGVRE